MHTPRPGKAVPAYAWSWPTSKAFVVVRAAYGTTFAALHSWSIGQSVPRGDLQKIIPANVQGHSNCQLTGTQYGAIAVNQCSRLNSLAAGTIIYYLYPNPGKLTSGFNLFLSNVGFHRQRECTTGGAFTDFLIECRSGFNNSAPFMTGNIAEYTTSSNDPIIVSTYNQQNVMVVMVGTNPGDLLTYWKKFQWAVTGS